MPSDNDLFQLRGLHRHADDFLEKVKKMDESFKKLAKSCKELERSARMLAESGRGLRKVMRRADDRPAVADGAVAGGKR